MHEPVEEDQTTNTVAVGDIVTLDGKPWPVYRVQEIQDGKARVVLIRSLSRFQRVRNV
jgi:hypothetical protein